MFLHATLFPHCLNVSKTPSPCTSLQTCCSVNHSWPTLTWESNLSSLSSSSSAQDAPRSSAGPRSHTTVRLKCFRCRWTPGKHTHLQVFDGELLLKDVGGVGPGSQAGHGGQVAAVSAHRLHDEDAALGPCCRLLDSVTGLQGKKPRGSWFRCDLTSIEHCKCHGHNYLYCFKKFQQPCDAAILRINFLFNLNIQTFILPFNLTL